MSHHRNRKRRAEYIPEERYDVDGTLIKNEEAFKPKRWDLKEIINDPAKNREALKEAQMYLKEKKNEKESSFYETTRAWTEETDNLFFSKRNRGLVSWLIPTGSTIYYEFEGFYLKLKSSVCDGKTLLTPTQADRMKIVRQEGEMIRHTLVLFQDFQNKKREGLKKKIEETKAALPVTPFANAIVQTLKQHRILLIAGDTGCGKSTQVPQILMNAGFNKIACTQPRRIACSSLARRVSYETMNEYGSKIAYQVRFEGTKTSRTRILFLTEGLLLRQYATDNMLSMYDVIVVDEVHERHMMGDFLLALLKKTLAQRKDLHVVLMSATINAELFAQYFDAPTLVVPGKMYSVKVHYWPFEEEDKNLVDEAAYRKRQTEVVKRSIPSRSSAVKADPYIKVLEYIDQSVPAGERGDLLIFMSGINEITTLAEELNVYAQKSKKWIILMLHSSLTVEDQEKVFDSPAEGIRKCIISSNIAETSITIDGIRFIIDSGKVKEMNHDPASKLSRLSEFWISKASAKQRTGRAGRTGPGECFRFYSENEFNHFHDFAIPEIQRETLDPLLLQIKSMGLGNPRVFDYIEAPSMDFINSSMDFLFNLGAIDANEKLLGLGSVLSKLPVDCIVGKMLILGVVFNIVDPILTIAAGMSVQSPFTRVTLNTNREYLKNKSEFDSKDGDPFTMLNLWQQWIEIKGSKTSSRKWCKEHLVEEHRLYEITKMKRQFEKVLNDFQPGLLESLQSMYDSDASDTDREKSSKFDAREQLRRGRYDEKSSKRRRILRMDSVQDDTQGDDTDSRDIRDLEFSLANNIKQLKSRAYSLSDREIQLVKLVLCSSLYPQLAIGDEHNPYRKSNEIVFQVPAKNFLSIHPSSVIASHPEWVQGHDEKTRKDDQTVEDSLYQQLLCYLQLLETNKPFLVNITRVPGIHTLLLFGKVIDLNYDCSVIVVDSYFVIRFKTSQVAEYVVYLSQTLRREWNSLMNLRISRGLGEAVDDSVDDDLIISSSTKSSLPLTIQQMLEDKQKSNDSDENIDMWTPEAEKKYQLRMQSLNRRLVEFMDTAISAELKAAKASELLKMYPKYIESSEKTDDGQTYPREWKPKDVIRSGIRITQNLYYNSIDMPSCASAIPASADSIPVHIRTFWYCQGCKTTYSFNKMQATEHVLEKCSSNFTEQDENLEKPHLIE
ncbi:putative ATP-dependent RNA helicase DHX34 [Mucor lusitanicus]|uniref:Putative ATP-dependent RNA helicase DHX34 n=1 Tax=Mucor circinelloides f. lusitanicus TaxID=29924 RepID=A0A8H4BT08_MUCCL|nr:putative ATP-dependent RNA helicase DHX34 [Mucor lusitanicus]